ncbi:hypothetical protein C1I63_18145 [Rathayibacter caricis DSM 15933]|uniref:Uncharacterized protein n=1 Tax=Rathayibacter caricis DSM 15933 TaxID=1328867 RepID=A0A2T4UNR2_9MICO|nr:hypothetical protein C1I63_18145 [Rathayibacter caricis DSM 15933]
MIERARGRFFLDGTSFNDVPDYVRAMIPADQADISFEEFAAGVRAATQERQPTDPVLYAPDAVEEYGRYYLYFCLSDDSEGVAIAASPAGSFRGARRLPISGIDPAVFLDEDGSAYLYMGHVRGQRGAGRHRPGHDRRALDRDGGGAEHFFHEGSSLRKRGDLYYLVFCETSCGTATTLGYATSTSPLGPFTYRGVIIDNAPCDPESWNIHGSIEEFGGQWYVFYTGRRRTPRRCVGPSSSGSNSPPTVLPRRC